MVLCPLSVAVDSVLSLYAYAVVISIYEDYPRFAKVEDIYVADGKIVFEVKLYETIAYCTHFHAYQVKRVYIGKKKPMIALQI